MPLPVGHALAGASVALACSLRRPSGEASRLAVIGGVIGVVPDLDYLLSWSHFLGRHWHHGFTHSLLFAVILGAAASRMAGPPDTGRTATLVAAALAHPALDFVFTESGGLALFWPITEARYKLGIEGFNYYASDAHGRFAGILITSGIELLLFGTILGALVLMRRRIKAGPG